MPKAPKCKRLGRQCRELDVTVRISDIDDDSKAEQDAAATWLTGHTEHITWGKPYLEDRMFQVTATIHAPCRYLKKKGKKQDGEKRRVRCKAHGFEGPMPESSRPKTRRRLQFSDDRFVVIHKRTRQKLNLPEARDNGRALPVIQPDNPCLTASCETRDGATGAACCRDMTLEIDLPKREKLLEALLRTRKAPNVSQFSREDDDTVECEVISACGYLNRDDGINCTLHGRERPNGQSAKPALCYEWPDLGEDETGHEGCVFI